jgi:hypothetical protein
MPYVSDKQRKKFHAMEDQGEISHSTVKHWDKESKGKKLPERKGKKSGVAGWASKRATKS